MPVVNQSSILKSFDSEAVTIDATVGGVGLTTATFNPTVTDRPGLASEAVLATLQNAGAEIRIALDGSAPTSAVGVVIADGASFEMWGIGDITAFRAIRTGGVSSILTAIYSRHP